MLKMMIVAVVGLLVAALATNPDETAHSRAMVQHVKAKCADNTMARALCGGVASLATMGVVYEDHILYSSARMGEIETLGVFGKVMVVDE